MAIIPCQNEREAMELQEVANEINCASVVIYSDSYGWAGWSIEIPEFHGDIFTLKIFHSLLKNETK